MKDVTLNKTVTKNMRVALAAKGLQQKDLAEALGITTASMSAKFKGRTMWNLWDIEKASDFFNVKPEALVAGHGFEPWTSGSLPRGPRFKSRDTPVDTPIFILAS